jgi:hypothetical protein
MPKLILLGACEKVIIDRSQLPSMINIFQRMTFEVADVPLPENAVAPTRWDILAIWQHTPEEKAIEFIQHTSVISPDESIFAQSVTIFKVTDDNDLQSKNVIQIMGVPVSKEGRAVVKVSIEGLPDSAAEFQFLISHVRKDQGTSAGQV